jgi:GTPase SAR1 family protein
VSVFREATGRSAYLALQEEAENSESSGDVYIEYSLSLESLDLSMILIGEKIELYSDSSGIWHILSL